MLPPLVALVPLISLISVVAMIPLGAARVAVAPA
jgi:hypothetical protein